MSMSEHCTKPIPRSVRDIAFGMVSKKEANELTAACTILHHDGHNTLKRGGRVLSNAKGLASNRQSMEESMTWLAGEGTAKGNHFSILRNQKCIFVCSTVEPTRTHNRKRNWRRAITVDVGDDPFSSSFHERRNQLFKGFYWIIIASMFPNLSSLLSPVVCFMVDLLYFSVS